MPTALTQLSDALAALVDEAAASLLSIRSARFPATAVAWSDEHAVTVAHVMGRAREGEVRLADGSLRNAHLVGRDPATDIAVIRVDGGGLVPARWDDDGAAALKVGHLALALALSPSGARAALGVVAAVGERWRTASGGDIDRWLDVDASLPRGGSGGVLLDVNGRVLGLNTAALVRGGTTVPTKTVRRAVERILQHGDVKSGWLGVGVHRGQLSKEQADEVGQVSALLVTSVAEESPAAKAGVLTGDALLELGGNRLTSFEDLVAALGQLGGVTSTLRLLRGGRALTIDVTPAEREPRARC